MTALDSKGIFTYLAAAFAMAYGIEAALLWTDIIAYKSVNPQATVLFLGVNLIPALAAGVALLRSRRLDIKRPRFYPLPPARLGLILAGVPFLTGLIFFAEYALGISELDLQLTVVLSRLPAAEELNLPFKLTAPFLIVLGAGADLFLLPFVFWLLVAASEFAWRGYLMPRLMPLGRMRAYAVLAVCWVAWFAPVALSDPVSSTNLLSTLLRVSAMAVLMSVILNEVARRTENLGLSALLAACFLAQTMGITGQVFDYRPAPFGGPFGLIALSVWATVCLAILLWPEKKPSHSN